MWACDNNNANQHFEVVAPAAVADARQKARIAAGVDDDIALYQSGQPFMLRLLGKNNLCADDGGGSDSNTKFKDQTCDPSSPNQIFTYNALTRQLQSVNKPGQCIDDGGATAPGSTQVSLRTCDATNPNQWFWMDDNLLFHNPVKNNLCLDDGAATGPGTTTTWLWACDPNNANQHFEVVSPASFLDAEKEARIAAGTQDDFDLLLSGQSLMLRLRGKNNLCVDDGSFFSITDPIFADQTCDPDSPSQIFTYNSQTRQFQSVKKPGMCIDDGGSVGPVVRARREPDAVQPCQEQPVPRRRSGHGTRNDQDLDVGLRQQQRQPAFRGRGPGRSCGC
ncbi:hypothetical protein ON010_g19097 [Phytophthora cinnamomi]|nr:hypothetical protein ON010_g19097 [Phytophthora cinnamomi]